MIHRGDLNINHRNKRVCRIAIYHDISEKCLDNFEKQVKYYHNNYRILSLNDFIVELNEGTKEDNSALCLTFDDAYKSIYQNAAPILDKYKIKPCIFVPVGFIDGEDNQWYIRDNFKANIKGGAMSWEDLKSLINRGYEIGSHSWSHVDFGSKGIDYGYELADSRNHLQKMLGQKIKYFAFPFGMERNLSFEAINKVKEYNYSRCFSGIRRNPEKNDFLLPRTYINPYWNEKIIECVLAGYFDKKKEKVHE